MKKILLVTTLIFIFSCKKDNPAENKIVENAAENTESSFPITRMGSSQDILNGMYAELMKNDSELKKLDDKINLLQQDSKKMKDIYQDVINNSEDYYNIAQNKAKTIQDSTLKKEILNLVKNSSEKFDLKKDKLEELKKQVNLNYNKIFSFYDAIKIRKTLPEIEKYQNANPLKIDSLENIIKKQNQLLVELKNLK